MEYERPIHKIHVKSFARKPFGPNRTSYLVACSNTRTPWSARIFAGGHLLVSRSLSENIKVKRWKEFQQPLMMFH